MLNSFKLVQGAHNAMASSYSQKIEAKLFVLIFATTRTPKR